jgi:hypothetical protein
MADTFFVPDGDGFLPPSLIAHGAGPRAGMMATFER